MKKTAAILTILCAISLIAHLSVNAEDTQTAFPNMEGVKILTGILTLSLFCGTVWAFRKFFARRSYELE